MFQKSTRLAALSLGLVSAIFLSGCNAKDSQDLSRDAAKFAESSTRSLVNASLSVKVSTVLALRKGVDMTRFSVKSEGGVITLDGVVETAKEKRTILELSRETKGVEKVVDKLTVETKK